MRNRFDQLGKKIGLSALGSCGLTVANDEISPDAQHADLRHVPDPERRVERALLGLLGRIGSVLCLIEIYSEAPGEEEALACLGKVIAFRQKRRRDMKRRRSTGRSGEAPARPFLWILSAGRPMAVLSALAAIPGQNWPSGVYFAPGTLLDVDGHTPLQGLDGAGGLTRMGIVVASELPRDRTTILVRLMAGGPVLRGALEDLGALPADAHEHAVASQILLGLRHAFPREINRGAEEQELSMDLEKIGARVIEKASRQARKEGLQTGREEGLQTGREEGLQTGREEGLQTGREEGRLLQARASVQRALELRKVPLSAEEEAKIQGCKDLATLERWFDQALTAGSAAEALDDRGTVRRRRAGARSGK